MGAILEAHFAGGPGERGQTGMAVWVECTVTSDGEEVIAAGRGVEQNQCAHDSDDLRAGSYRGRGVGFIVVLIGAPRIVATVVLG